MDSDLLGLRDGHAERYVPEAMSGGLTEAEHLARYWWAATLARGRRVLDAACGVGFGCAILAESGAAEVVGVDRATEMVEAVRPRMPDRVVLEVADVQSLPFPDGSFELAVCFETIEHVEAPDIALDELARVLGPEGVLVVSTPNRRVFLPGNPHHHHEYVPEELEEALSRRFGHVRLVRQESWVASAVLEDPDFTSTGTPLADAEVRLTSAGELGSELYTIGLASDGPLPQAQAVTALGPLVEIRELHDEIGRHHAEAVRARTEADEHRARAARLESSLSERDQAEAALEAALEVERRRGEAAETELAALRATRLLRYTRQLRALYARLR